MELEEESGDWRGRNQTYLRETAKHLESCFNHEWVVWVSDLHINWFLLSPYLIPNVGRHLKMAEHICWAAVKGPRTLFVENCLLSHWNPTLRVLAWGRPVRQEPLQNHPEKTLQRSLLFENCLWCLFHHKHFHFCDSTSDRYFLNRGTRSFW